MGEDRKHTAGKPELVKAMTPDIIEESLAIAQNTRSQLANLLAEINPSLNFQPLTQEQWIERIQERPGLELLGKFLNKGKLREITKPHAFKRIFHSFFGFEPNFDFEKIKPFADVLFRNLETVRVDRKTRLPKYRKQFGDAEIQALILVRVCEFLQALASSDDWDYSRDVSGALLPLRGAADRVWLAFLETATGLVSQAGELQAFLHYSDRCFAPFFKNQLQHTLLLDFIITNFYDAYPKIMHESVHTLDQIAKDLDICSQIGDNRIANSYTRCLPLVLENCEFSVFVEITRLLIKKSNDDAHHFLYYYPKFEIPDLTLIELKGKIEDWFSQDRELPSYFFEPMLHPIAKPECFTLWNLAMTLHDQVTAFASSMWLKWAPRHAVTHGMAGVTRWLNWGLELQNTCGPAVAALFFSYGSECIPEQEVPDSSFFESLKMRCRESEGSIEWMRSYFRLHHKDVANHLAFNRWINVCASLRLKYPGVEVPDSYCFWEKDKVQVLEQIELWEKFADTGYHGFYSKEVRKSFPVEQRHYLGAKYMFWKLVADAVEGEQRVLYNSKLLNYKWEDDQLQLELSQLTKASINRKLPPIDSIGDHTGTLVLSDLIPLINTKGFEVLGKNNLIPRLDAALQSAREFLPKLAQLYQDFGTGPTTHSFKRVEFRLNQWHSLIEILPFDNRTGSCTDGPWGRFAEASIIHGMHNAGLKVLVYAQRNSDDDGFPFGSIPLFRVETASGPGLLVDSLDFGDTLDQIESGSQYLARRLAQFLVDLSRDLKLNLLINPNIFNTKGMEVLEHLVASDLLKREAVDLSIESGDLKSLGIPHFYLDTFRNRIGNHGYVPCGSKLTQIEVFKVKI